MRYKLKQTKVEVEVPVRDGETLVAALRRHLAPTEVRLVRVNGDFVEVEHNPSRKPKRSG